MEMRAICLPTERTCFPDSWRWPLPMLLAAASRYSPGTPSTISMLATPRMDSALNGGWPVSMVNQDVAAVCQVIDLAPAGDGTIVHLFEV